MNSAVEQRAVLAAAPEELLKIVQGSGVQQIPTHSAEMHQVRSGKPMMTGQKLGPMMSAEEGAAAGACILSYLRCAGSGKENQAATNSPREGCNYSRKTRRTKKGKAGKRKNSDAFFAHPEKTEAGDTHKRKMDHSEKQDDAADDVQSSPNGELQRELQSCGSAVTAKGAGWSEERCQQLIEQLDISHRSGDRLELHVHLLFVIENSRELALSRHGCRVVQKALEVASGADRDALLATWQNHVIELYESPHGNYVLAKAVEVLPRNKLTFIVSALKGRGLTVSKHRNGCRVVCRLIEHASEEEVGDLLDEILPDSEFLAKHQYGNYVISMLLEQGSPARRAAVLEKLLPSIPQLAQHRFGSLVIQKLLDFCHEEGKQQVIKLLTATCVQNNTCALLEAACNHYGSFVVEQLANEKVSYFEVHELLQANAARLRASGPGQRVISAFKL